MLASARNQFNGKISSITLGAVHDEVEIGLASGQKIVAVLTHSSTLSLGLAVGADAIALVKAFWVVLLTDTTGVRLSARNQLAGTVEKVTPGGVSVEVTLRLGGGELIAAIVTKESAIALGLAPGIAATAVFKASSVIVGVKS